MSKERKWRHLRPVDEEFVPSDDLANLTSELKTRVLSQELSDLLLQIRSSYNPEANHDLNGFKLMKGFHETAVLATVFHGDIDRYVAKSIEGLNDTEYESALLYDSWSMIRDLHSLPPEDSGPDAYIALIEKTGTPIWLHKQLRAPLVLAVNKVTDLTSYLASQEGQPIFSYIGEIQTGIAVQGLGADTEHIQLFYDRIEGAVENARSRWLRECLKSV